MFLSFSGNSTISTEHWYFPARPARIFLFSSLMPPSKMKKCTKALVLRRRDSMAVYMYLL